MPGSVTEELASFWLDRPLRGLIRRPPVVLAPDAPVRSAIELLQRERIGAVAVAQPADMLPQGIATWSGLAAWLIAPGSDPAAPLAQAMSCPPVTLSQDGTVRDAMLVMARHAVRHVLLLEPGGRMTGVLSRGDVYSGLCTVSKEVIDALGSAHSMTELAAAATDARAFGRGLLAQGLCAELVMRWITALNDLIGLQVIRMMKNRFELPEVAWCWMAFGSEARCEQTFATDQDNGLMFATPEGTDAEALRTQFLPFAQAVNQALDDCGLPLCKGQIMAGNPAWCLSEREWRARFRDWIVCGDAKALLNASIFFDFRSLYGDAAMVEALREWLLQETAASALFLRLMAQNALQCQPPIGLIRSFVVDRDKVHRDTIDLKMAGSRPYVDAARLFALANGVAATGTADRLRAAAHHAGFAKEDLQAVIEGFHFVQMLRLHSQLRTDVGESALNRINPYQLNGMRRFTLRHAFRQARRLQQRLKADHRL